MAVAATDVLANRTIKSSTLSSELPCLAAVCALVSVCGANMAAEQSYGASKLRDILVAWVGPKVGAMEKGRKKPHLATVQEVMKVPVMCSALCVFSLRAAIPYSGVRLQPAEFH